MRLGEHKHDKVIRKALENPKAAYEFLDTNLPAEVKAVLDLATLKMESESFIEPKLQESICDILYSVKHKNKQQGYIFCLIEHQSTPQHWMAFRILKYMTAIWDRYLNLNPKDKYLPPIYPIVYYSGTRPYNASTDLWSLFYDKELAQKLFTEGYKLINIQKDPGDIVKEKLWLSTLNFFLKHIRDRDLLRVWEQMIHHLADLIKVTNGDEYIKIFIAYSLTIMEDDDTMKLKNMLTTNLGKTGEEIMASTAKKLFDEGLQKGKLEGLQKGKAERNKEIVLNLLKSKAPIDLIVNATGLSIKEIEKLKDK